MGRQREKKIGQWYLWNRKDSAYWYVWRYDEDNPKRKIRKQTTKKKADYTREQMLRLINKAHGIVPPEKTTDYSIDWFEEYIMRKLRLEDRSESTKRNYRAAFSYLRKCYDSDYSVLNIGRDSIDKVKEAMLSDGKERRTINRYLNDLRASFRRLLLDDRIDRNPFHGFIRMKERDDKKKHLTLSELRDFLDSVKQNESEDLWRLLRIYSGTGRRRSELLQLTHESVDLERGIYRWEDCKHHDKFTRRIPDNIFEDMKYFITRYQDRVNPFKIYSDSWLTHKVIKLSGVFT